MQCLVRVSRAWHGEHVCRQQHHQQIPVERRRRWKDYIGRSKYAMCEESSLLNSCLYIKAVYIMLQSDTIAKVMVHCMSENELVHNCV